MEMRETERDTGEMTTMGVEVRFLSVPTSAATVPARSSGIRQPQYNTRRSLTPNLISPESISAFESEYTKFKIKLKLNEPKLVAVQS